MIRFLAISLVAFGMSSSSLAEIRYFSNSSAAFTWTESFQAGSFQHGDSLDITLPASQSGDQSPLGIMSYREIFFSSGEVVATKLRPDELGGRVRIARGEPVEIGLGTPFQRTLDPVVSFPFGELIGVGSAHETWANQADVNYRFPPQSMSFIDGRGFVGIQLELDDGIHYGWIDLIDLGYDAEVSFVAAGWAYETVPDRPIVAGVIPTPAAGALAMLPMFSSLRRRRR